jgi:hypothetical protein
MSRFFYRGGSDSESSSSDEEEDVYERSEEEEGSDEESSDQSDSGSDESDESDDEAIAKGGASAFLKDESESEEEEEEEKVTVVKSAKDKRLEGLENTIKLIENAQKINDWSVISTGESCPLHFSFYVLVRRISTLLDDGAGESRYFGNPWDMMNIWKRESALTIRHYRVRQPEPPDRQDHPVWPRPQDLRPGRRRSRGLCQRVSQQAEGRQQEDERQPTEGIQCR